MDMACQTHNVNLVFSIKVAHFNNEGIIKKLGFIRKFMNMIVFQMLIL